MRWECRTGAERKLLKTYSSDRHPRRETQGGREGKKLKLARETEATTNEQERSSILERVRLESRKSTLNRLEIGTEKAT